MPSVQTGGGLTLARKTGWDSAAGRQRRASAGTAGIRRRAWRQRPPAFAEHYPASAEGLRAAEEELVRLVEMHSAYATQPNITAIWQRYVEQKAAAVSAQRLIIKRRTDALARSPASRPRERFT